MSSSEDRELIWDDVDDVRAWMVERELRAAPEDKGTRWNFMSFQPQYKRNAIVFRCPACEGKTFAVAHAVRAATVKTHGSYRTLYSHVAVCNLCGGWGGVVESTLLQGDRAQRWAEKRGLLDE